MTSTATPSLTPIRVPETVTPFLYPLTPNPNARFHIYALSAGVSPDDKPVNPGDRFEPGFKSIFVFYEFSDINWGVTVTRALYRGDSLLSVTQERWDNLPDGRGYYYFFELVDGFTPGEYQVRFFIGESLSARATFIVEEES